ncbi:MAG: peptidoglycan DD-metalloendopeptidase family protein [Caulobacteraceae bacterium]
MRPQYPVNPSATAPSAPASPAPAPAQPAYTPPPSEGPVQSSTLPPVGAPAAPGQTTTAPASEPPAQSGQPPAAQPQAPSQPQVRYAPPPARTPYAAPPALRQAEAVPPISPAETVPPPPRYVTVETPVRRTTWREVADGRVIAARGMYRDYVVERHDHVDLIARALGTTREVIVRANHLKGPYYRLHPGQHLKVPVEKAYEAESGDTLAAVARRFDVDLSYLASLNDLTEKRRLSAGEEIALPDDFHDLGPSREKVVTTVMERRTILEPSPRRYARAAAPAPTTQAAAPQRYAYATPPAYRAPAPASRAPAPVYRPPAPSYSASAPVYRPPVPAYRAPAPSYGPSAPVYRPPAPAYRALVPAYPQTASSSSSPTPQGGIYHPRNEAAVEGRRPYASPSPPAAPNRAPQTYAYATPPPPVYRPPVYRPPVYRAPGAPQAGPTASVNQVLSLARGRFIWPVRGEVISSFGVKGEGRRNDGVDLSSPLGSVVRAAAAGQVVYAGDQVPGFGNLVLIKHADGWVTAYAHLETVDVQMRQEVSQGEEIGQVGESGGVGQPQLHFEVRYAATPADRAMPVNPLLVLPK